MGTARGCALHHLSKLRTAYNSWLKNEPDSQPESPRYIRFQHNSPGRPCPFARRHELFIADAIRYFANNSTPLPKEGVLDLFKQYIDWVPRA